LGPPYISGMLEARNFKFGMEIDSKKLYRKYVKLGQTGYEGVT